MSTYRFDKLLTPRSVAVVGAGEREGSLGRSVLGNLRRGGFSGPILSVHPDAASVDGLACVPRIADLSAAPDLVVIAVPPTLVPDVVAQAAAIGTRAAVILTAGLGREPGDPGPRSQTIARAHGLRLLGPDSAGLAVPGSKLNASLFAHAPAGGDLALISQSGTVAAAIVEWAGWHGAGFSAVLSLGSVLDIGVADCLDHFAGDYRTRAILLCLDRVADARRFMSAARAAARTKPVVVLRTGRHRPDTRAAVTHTGALARPDAVYAAAFRRAGLLAVQDLDEMFSAAETLGRQRPFPGQRLAILTNGRGIGWLAADRLTDREGRLADLPATERRPAGNPVDLGLDADGPAFASALAPMLTDRDSDAVLAIHVPTARSDAGAVAQAIAETVKRSRAGQTRKKPVFAVSLGEAEAAGAAFAKAGIPHFSTDSEAIEGFLHLVRYREAQDDLMRTPDSLPREFSPDVERAPAPSWRAALRQRGRSWLDPLAVGGPPRAAYRHRQSCRSRSLPMSMPPRRLPGPSSPSGGAVALKVVSPDIVHKSDVGGVRIWTSPARRMCAPPPPSILTRARRAAAGCADHGVRGPAHGAQG